MACARPSRLPVAKPTTPPPRWPGTDRCSATPCMLCSWAIRGRARGARAVRIEGRSPGRADAARWPVLGGTLGMPFALARDVRLTGLSHGAVAVSASRSAARPGRRIPALRRRDHNRLAGTRCASSAVSARNCCAVAKAEPGRARRAEQLRRGTGWRAAPSCSCRHRLASRAPSLRAGERRLLSTRVRTPSAVGQVLDRGVARDCRRPARLCPRPERTRRLAGRLDGRATLRRRICPARFRPSSKDRLTSSVAGGDQGGHVRVAIRHDGQRPSAVAVLSSASQADAAFAHRGCVAGRSSAPGRWPAGLDPPPR